MKEGKKFKGFDSQSLNSLPVNYSLLTFFEFKSVIITSDSTELYNGIYVEALNGKIMTSEKPFSPILSLQIPAQLLIISFE